MDDPVTTYRVAVFEVEDVFPRLRADRSNVYVGWSTRARFDDYVAAILNGDAGPQDIRGRVRRHAPELTEWQRPRFSPKGAKALKRKVGHRLENRGHRVIVGGGDVAVYVIELDGADAGNPIDRAWLYVGHTGKTVRERYDEHLTGTGSRVTRGRCLGLRDDLAPNDRVRPTSASTPKRKSPRTSLTVATTSTPTRSTRASGPASPMLGRR